VLFGGAGLNPTSLAFIPNRNNSSGGAVHRSMNLNGKRILVIGASGVLGGHLTEALIQRGALVYGTARDLTSAERVSPRVVQRIVLDLNDSASIAWATDWVNQNVEVDGVIVASGRVAFGKIAETTPEQLALLNRVNFEGPAAVLTGLAENLSARGESFVAAITGVVAEKTFPGMAAYSASKSAFAAWLSGLRLELKSKGVTVLDARPGHTETGLATRPAFGAAPAFPTGMTPEHVVARIIEAIESGASELSSKDF
jgi:cyclic-di-GMP-binding biofilm dispersal mediator protein